MPKKITDTEERFQAALRQLGDQRQREVESDQPETEETTFPCGESCQLVKEAKAKTASEIFIELGVQCREHKFKAGQSFTSLYLKLECPECIKAMKEKYGFKEIQ